MNQLGVGYVIPSIAFQKIVEVFPARRVASGRRAGATQRRISSARRTRRPEEEAPFEADAV